MFESVVFPAPFSPRRACTSPTPASNVTSSFASTPGKRFVMPCMRTAGTGEAPDDPAPLSCDAVAGARSPTRYPGGSTEETFPTTPLTSHCIVYRSFSSLSCWPGLTLSLPDWS